jgi:sulfopyruvate decarboxylase alpha subunit
MAYVPDAGHTTLIKLFSADPAVISTVLTTEEEGVAISAGAWLGGQRTVLLMQSSGVGNCINMLSLPVMGRFPLLMLVTMRGEWAEFNPWQVPMGRATQPALEAVGVRVMRADDPVDLIETVAAAASLAYEAINRWLFSSASACLERRSGDIHERGQCRQTRSARTSRCGRGPPSPPRCFARCDRSWIAKLRRACCR